MKRAAARDLVRPLYLVFIQQPNSSYSRALPLRGGSLEEDNFVRAITFSLNEEDTVVIKEERASQIIK